MKLKLTLTMNNLVVADRNVDQVAFQWTSELSRRQVNKLCQEWIKSNDFLTKRMAGLSRVGVSSLDIETDGKGNGNAP